MKQLRILLLFVATITLFSCSSGSDDGTGGGGGSSTAYTSLTMISTKTTVAVGDYITYVSKGNNTTDVSSQAKLYINGALQIGNIVQMNTAGTFDVYSTYVNANNVTLTSNTIQVKVLTPINYTKRVLVEDFTGTWCGWCPRVSYGAEQVVAQTDKAEIVAIHQGSDPYNISTGSYSVTGYPTANLNRTTTWEYPEPSNVNQVVALTNGTNPKLGVAINSTLANGSISADVKVKFGFDFTNLKLVVYVVENGLIYNQTNYTTYYGGGSVIPNFVHNHVLRKIVTDISGDVITGNTNQNDVYTKNFTFAVPSNVSNSSNLDIVAFVIDSTGKAINVRTGAVGTNQTFEQL
ncbi:MAG: Omp28-related outer membrane protein [Flavobacterium sp.]|jgi:hypothetical protein|nr:Omp28-related outer membrane protein [Flavobacterium sp.]